MQVSWLFARAARACLNQEWCYWVGLGWGRAPWATGYMWHPINNQICSRLLGIWDDTGKEADCSQSEERPYRFGVGHRSVSHTNKTSWMVGHYLGDPANPCITVIDTPGTGDTEGRDCDHAVAIAKGLQEIGKIETFLLLYKGTNVRWLK